MATANPTYDEEYEAMDPQFKEIITDDIKMDRNPDYTEEKFT